MIGIVSDRTSSKGCDTDMIQAKALGLDAFALNLGKLVGKYGKMTSQLTVSGKAFVSSFVGRGVTTKKFSDAAGVDVFWGPNYQPQQVGDLDSLFNWMAWLSDGNNRAPSSVL